MVKYSLAHIGINAANKEEAQKAAELFQALFGFSVKEGNSSFFAGDIELMKEPYMGKNGHIAIGTPDVAAAKAELETRGIVFNDTTAKYKADGTLNAIYLSDEICGFAVHLVGKQ
ncbi:MAG TPA: VOC family protein [Candidatus Agathobaculum pullicola]|nr:VOC family protein [Candidatus Agathobaculum pullicola]